MEISALTAISLAFLFSFLISELAHHFKYPRVLGQIVAGAIIGLPFFRGVITGEAMADISFMSELGVIFLFLVIGMELNLEVIKRERVRSTIIGVAGIVMPLLCGYAVGQLLGYTNFTSLVIGVCLAISSETTNTQVFMEMGFANRRLPKILFGAAMIDDLFAILFLTFMIPVLQGDVQEVASIPVKIIGFLAVIWGLIKLMPHLVDHIERDQSNVAQVSMMVLFGLLVAVLSIELGLGEMIGSFLAGIIIQVSLREECKETGKRAIAEHERKMGIFKQNVEILKVTTLSFIVPFFFINMGLQIDLVGISEHIPVVIAILIAGIVGKLSGAFLVRSWTQLSIPQTWIVGWGMNSRGTIELVIAQLAFSNGIIDSAIYGGLVVMVLTTTIMFPFFLKRLCKKHPDAITSLEPLN